MEEEINSFIKHLCQSFRLWQRLLINKYDTIQPFPRRKSTPLRFIRKFKRIHFYLKNRVKKQIN
jgi:hypothetical protein